MIQVRDLRFTYPGRREETIRGIDFTIERGEVFGFLGPSGAGKSTTQKILIGILKDYQGDVQVLGKQLCDVNSEYYERIGVAFEFPNFYSKFSALENLQFFRRLYAGETEEPMQLLERVGLAKDAKTKFGDFSKGMKMRLNFCRALLNRPEIIFLDEPTSGLDPVNAKVLKDHILELKAQGKTVVITTHNMAAAEELCDRVAFIVDGQIPLIDSPRGLKLLKGKKVVRVEYRTEGRLESAEYDLATLGQNPDFLRMMQGSEIVTMHSKRRRWRISSSK